MGRTSKLRVGTDRFGRRAVHGVSVRSDMADASCRLKESGAEVDFVLEAGRELWTIEVKAARTIAPAMVSGRASLPSCRREMVGFDRGVWNSRSA